MQFHFRANKSTLGKDIPGRLPVKKEVESIASNVMLIQPSLDLMDVAINVARDVLPHLRASAPNHAIECNTPKELIFQGISKNSALRSQRETKVRLEKEKKINKTYCFAGLLLHKWGNPRNKIEVRT